MRWIRAKYKGKKSRLGMREMRHRFCIQGWRFTHNGVVFTGASSVPVTRYRYRGSKIPTPGLSIRQPPPTAEPTGTTRGEPGAVRAARRVRRADRGNPPGATLAGRPGPTQPSPGRGPLSPAWAERSRAGGCRFEPAVQSGRLGGCEGRSGVPPFRLSSAAHDVDIRRRSNPGRRRNYGYRAVGAPR
jgi:hypothetical protein